MSEPHNTLATKPLSTEPKQFPTLWEGLIVSSPAFLEKFYAAYFRWDEMKRRGVRFSRDMPHIAIRSGWGAAKKAPLPFVALAQATLSPQQMTLFGVDFPNQEIVHKRLFGFADMEKSINYVNLDKGLQWETRLSDIRDIRWYVMKPVDGIGRIPTSQHFILIEADTRGTSTILIQCAPDIERKLEISQEELEQRTIEQSAASLQRTQALYQHLHESWQAATAGNEGAAPTPPSPAEEIEPPIETVAELKDSEHLSAESNQTGSGENNDQIAE